MNAPPDMKEFARLNQLWLDGMATAEEAAAHWGMVAEHRECLREMAAAARFEVMLEKRLGEEEQVSKAAVLLQMASAERAKRSWTWSGMVKPALSVAAMFVVMGILWWMLAQEEGRNRMARDVVGGSISKPQVTQPVRLHVDAVATPEVRNEGAVIWTAESLRTWLNAYYLKGVDLNKVTLTEALGRLQADMLAVNFLNADVVGKLKVTVSTDAAGRRVSLKAGSISFMKAVQTLAAQAGCEVEVGELLLAVESRDQPFPQPTARHDMREVLAGRFDADGVAEADRPDLLAKVWADAVEQGFVAAAEAGTGKVRLTEGQVETLRGLAEARTQLDQLPGQTYQLRLAAPGGSGSGRMLEEVEVKAILEQSPDGTPTRVVTVKPGQRLALDGEGMQLPGVEVELLPVGQGFQVGLFVVPVVGQWKLPGKNNLVGIAGESGDAERLLNSTVVAATPPVVVMSGQGALLNLDGGTVGGLSIRSESGTLGTMTNTLHQGGMTNSISNATTGSQVLLLPVNPVGETPQ